MFVHAIDDGMLLKGAFRALCRSCNLQGVLKLNNVDVAHLVPRTLSCLGFAKRTGPFPCDGGWGVLPSPTKKVPVWTVVLPLRLVSQALARPASLTQQGGALYVAPALQVQCRGAQVGPLMECPAPLYRGIVISSSFC